MSCIYNINARMFKKCATYSRFLYYTFLKYCHISVLFLVNIRHTVKVVIRFSFSFSQVHRKRSYCSAHPTSETAAVDTTSLNKTRSFHLI